jgi:hypothetical protein
MRIALLALLAVAPLAAQEAPKEPPKPRVKKIVELKYADPEGIRQLIEVFGCCSRSNTTFKTLSLDYPEDVMPAVEDAIRRFDVPAAAPKNVELSIWYLIASEKEPEAGAPIPPELEPTVKQLRSVFAFKGFSVLDSLLARMGSGQGSDISGGAALTAGAPPAITQFRVQRWSLGAGEKGEVLTLEKLRAGLRLHVASTGYIDTGFNLERIDIPVGQKVVVGKSNLEGPGKALVIVLSAKVL